MTKTAETKGLLSSPKCGYSRVVQRPEREVQHSSVSGAEVRKEGSCTSTLSLSLYAFIVGTGTGLPFHFKIYSSDRSRGTLRANLHRYHAVPLSTSDSAMFFVNVRL